MKTILGLIIMALSIILGLYIGIWVMFIGGIVGLVEQIPEIMQGDIHGTTIGINVFKIISSSVVGMIGGFFPFIYGWKLLDS